MNKVIKIQRAGESDEKNEKAQGEICGEQRQQKYSSQESTHSHHYQRYKANGVHVTEYLPHENYGKINLVVRIILHGKKKNEPRVFFLIYKLCNLKLSLTQFFLLENCETHVLDGYMAMFWHCVL